MNRFKKEEARKYRDARIGLSEHEIKRLDREDAIKAKINELARKIHVERFPEEYDHMYDSVAGAKERASGRNPMNSEYIAKVAIRRANAGVSALSESGISVSDDTWKIALREAEDLVRGKTG